MNRPVRTRTPGGVGRAEEKSALTRFKWRFNYGIVSSTLLVSPLFPGKSLKIASIIDGMTFGNCDEDPALLTRASYNTFRFPVPTDFNSTIESHKVRPYFVLETVEEPTTP